MDIFRQHREANTARPSVGVRCHARDLQLQSEAFGIGLAGQHDDGGVIRNTLIPLAFALASSEDSTATQLLLLQSTDGYLQEACGFTLKDAKVAHLDGGLGVKGFKRFRAQGLGV